MANTLGTRIGELRRKKGITQDQLAEFSGVSPQAVSKWENDMSCPDITLLPMTQLPQISGNQALKDIDFKAILLMAESGVIGKIVEVKSANGDNVEVVIE